MLHLLQFSMVYQKCRWTVAALKIYNRERARPAAQKSISGKVFDPFIWKSMCFSGLYTPLKFVTSLNLVVESRTVSLNMPLSEAVTSLALELASFKYLCHLWKGLSKITVQYQDQFCWLIVWTIRYFLNANKNHPSHFKSYTSKKTVKLRVHPPLTHSLPPLRINRRTNNTLAAYSNPLTRLPTAIPILISVPTQRTNSHSFEREKTTTAAHKGLKRAPSSSSSAAHLARKTIVGFFIPSSHFFRLPPPRYKNKTFFFPRARAHSPSGKLLTRFFAAKTRGRERRRAVYFLSLCVAGWIRRLTCQRGLLIYRVYVCVEWQFLSGWCLGWWL